MELEFEQEAVFQRLCYYLPCVMSGHSLTITGVIHLYWASQTEVASRVEDYYLEGTLSLQVQESPSPG